MNYSKILLIICSGIIFNNVQAAFNPRYIVELMDAVGKLKAHSELRLFAPEANGLQTTVNKFTNSLIPSKQEVIENIATDRIQHPKIAAYTLCAFYEAYERSAIKPFDKVDAGKYKAELTESAQRAFYNFWKDLLIQKIRAKIDPYLHEGLRKSEIMEHVKNRKLAVALKYVANRALNCALDMSCDATFDALKTRFIK